MHFSNILLLIFMLGGSQSCKSTDQPKTFLPNQEMALKSEWTFHQVGKDDWHEATVPGTVHTDLIDNKLIEDPFYRDNEEKVQWISEKDWEYKTEFDLYPSLLDHDHLELSFPGLDTYADIYLNDKLLGKSDNFFRTWTYDVKDILKDSANVLKIYFHSPEKFVEKAWKDLGYKLPGGIRTMTRKPGFHYGWDWGPKLISSGIWKTPVIKTWNDVRILDLYFRQDELDDTVFAEMTAVFTIEADAAKKVELMVYEDEVLTRKTVELKKGNHQYELPFSIPLPKLWWPNGLGEAHLYDLTGELLWDGRTWASENHRVGIRTIELVREKEGKGESFYFKVNGVPVFMKGANTIPQDIFQNRVSADDYKSLIEDAKEANMNMLRVWGGGIYEEDLFYSLCDEYGILVWQDFMFACAMYPGDEAYLDNVKEEAKEQTIRLRNHPSIALWCGNNENSEGWHRWGWQTPLAPKQNATIWKAYQDVFQKLLPEIVSKNTQTPYWESSPKYGRGNPQHQYEGDAHYWGVWHDAEPFENFDKKVPRFMSEFGFQSFPSMKTLETIALPEDMNIESAVMKSHQKHPRGNKLIREYMAREYKKADNFAQFVYQSQLLQAKGMELGMKAHRRAMPYCMGTLYWQFNDCWPVASWSGRDSYGNWKALHYAAKETFKPVILSPMVNGEQLDISVISDHLKNKKAILEVVWFSFNKKLKKASHSIDIAGNTSKVYLKSPLQPNKKFTKKEGFIKVILKDEKGKLLDQTFVYLDRIKNLKLVEPELKWETKAVSKTVYEVTVVAKKHAVGVRLETTDGLGKFSHNFFDMAPGEERKVILTLPENSVKPELNVSHLLSKF